MRKYDWQREGSEISGNREREEEDNENEETEG